MKEQENIFIYTTKVDFNMPNIDFKNAFSWLTEEEQYRIASKKNYKLRCQSLVSTLLIKKSLKDTFGLQESYLKIRRTSMNRPYIETNQKFNFDFNLSHSNEWIICGISLAGKLGIDIEEILPIDINVAKEFLSEEEWKYMCNCQGAKIKLFYKFWTLKESFLKAIGVGINDSIKEVNFGKLDNKSNIFSKNIKGHTWSFYHTVFNKNYALSLCSNNSIEHIKFYNYENLYDLSYSIPKLHYR